MSDSTGMTAEINDVQYSETTLIGVELPAGAEFKLLDIEIKAGNDIGNVLVLFEKI